MRVNYKQLRGRQGLTPVDGKKVLTAGFTNEDCTDFVITFEVDKNGGKRDVLISFESRTPRIFTSECYADENAKKRTIKENPIEINDAELLDAVLKVGEERFRRTGKNPFVF